MEEDNYAFEMFQELMQQLDDDNDTARIRVLSKDPRYAADDPAVEPIKTKHKER